MKSTPYARPVSRALPDVGLATPSVSRRLLAFLGVIAGPYLRLSLGFERVELRHVETFVAEVTRALRGETRLIVAFRHPFGDEAMLVSWVMARGVIREARRLGVRLPARPHAVFVHGYEVPRWSGPFVRWLLPRVGAMPVHHSKLDSDSLARIRNAIVDGPYPLAIAPEGQVSYTSEDVPRLEQGTMRLGFQAVEKLLTAGRSEHVRVLPLSIHNRYGPRALPGLRRLVSQIESFAGLTAPAGTGGGLPGLSERMSACLERVTELAERQYNLAVDAGRAIHERIHDIVEAALDASERLLGLPRGAGDDLDRLYRIRQTGWDRIFLAPGNNPEDKPPLERAIADRLAGEAWYALRHMELADFAWYLRSTPPPDGAPLHAIVEYAQNLWDFANRLAGGAISGRVNVRPKRAIVVVAPALDLTSRLPELHSGRKAAYAAAMNDLESSYRQCIKEMVHE
ncbi:MAG: acyltransferase [Spirochaetales bacterium]|nr:acyltransferase [Spirochaetales bacterium]